MGVFFGFLSFMFWYAILIISITFLLTRNISQDNVKSRFKKKDLTDVFDDLLKELDKRYVMKEADKK